MAGKKKQEVVTFKVDATLSKAMHGLPNRSEFIRSAILAALKNVCPLCKGEGLLTQDQRRHWDLFKANHSVVECEQCQALHLVCAAEKAESAH